MRALERARDILGGRPDRRVEGCRVKGQVRAKGRGHPRVGHEALAGPEEKRWRHASDPAP